MIFDQGLQTYLNSLPADEARAWTQKLDRFSGDCGCRIASIIMLATIALWIIYSLPSLSLRSWQHSVGMGILILFASGMVGKLIGLAFARVRFNLTVRSLRKRTCVPLIG